MHRYETLFLIQAGLPDERIDELIATFEAVIPENSGKMLKTDKWGRRKLAFRVGRHDEGYYCLYEYEGDGTTQRELERRMKINDDILRYLTTRVDPRMDAEIARKAERDKRAEARGERSFGRDDRDSRDDDDRGDRDARGGGRGGYRGRRSEGEDES
jgi:small subunit ribosomal protein S6